jgi:hypothetical protein
MRDNQNKAGLAFGRRTVSHVSGWVAAEAAASGHRHKPALCVAYVVFVVRIIAVVKIQRCSGRSLRNI